MDSKRFVKLTIAYSILLLVLVAATVIILDPFIRYHKPFFSLAAVETEERSSAIGIAKNMDYDTVLIGSSMSENFRRSWFEDGHFGTKCVKIPLQGGHYNDYKLVIDEVLKKDTTKNVILCLDTYLFIDNADSYPQTIEDYLVGTPSVSDVHYLFNKSVLFDYLPKYLVTNVFENYSDDNAYNWNDDYNYDKFSARLAYMNQRILRPQEEKSYDIFFENADRFSDALIEQIKQREDVTFYLYAPPYSMLFWDDVCLKGNATAVICTLDREYEKFLSLDNVRVFNFQDDTEITTDLNNYRDFSHYSGAINYRMYEYMRYGKHELTKETCYDNLLNMYYFIIDYDYEQCFH